MESASEKPPKSGSSRRKPAVTHRVVDGNSDDSSGNDSDDVGSSSLVIDSKNGSDSEHYEDMEVKTVTDENDANFDEDDNLVLPEGTVMVVPEPVDSKNSQLKGAESGKTHKKLKVKRKGKSSSAANRDGDIDEKIVVCSACSSQVNPKLSGTVHAHPALGVLVCKKCLRFYNSGSFSKDENGIDEYCRWCAEGGKLICCDFCTNAFCEGCIRRNLGRRAITKITKMDKWHCFMCDQSMLEDLKVSCQQVLQRNKEHCKHDCNHIMSEILLVLPSPEMSVKEGLAVCMDNSLRVTRFCREATQFFRKKIAGNHTSTSAVAKVGIKLKNFLKYTQQSLLTIDNDIDRELMKCQKEPKEVASHKEKQSKIKKSKEGKDDGIMSGLSIKRSFVNDDETDMKKTENVDGTSEANEILKVHNTDGDIDGMACFTDSDDSSPLTDRNKPDDIAENVSHAISLVDGVIADTFEEDNPAILNEACDPLLSSTPCVKSVIGENEQPDALLLPEVPDGETVGLGSLVEKSSDVTDLHDIGNPLHSDSLENLQPLCDAIVPQLNETESPPLTFYPSSEELKDDAEKFRRNSEEWQKSSIVNKKNNKNQKNRLKENCVSPRPYKADKDSELDTNFSPNKTSKTKSIKLPKVVESASVSSEGRDRDKHGSKQGHKKGKTKESQEIEETFNCKSKSTLGDEVKVDYKHSKPTPVITEIIETHELLSRLSSAMPENMLIVSTLDEHDLDIVSDAREAEVVLPDEQENKTKNSIQSYKPAAIELEQDNCTRPEDLAKSSGTADELANENDVDDDPDGKEASFASLENDDDAILNEAEDLLLASSPEDETHSRVLTPSALLDAYAGEHPVSDVDEEPLKKESSAGSQLSSKSDRQEDSDVDLKEDELDTRVEDESTIHLPVDDDDDDGDLVIAETSDEQLQISSEVGVVLSEDGDVQERATKKSLAKATPVKVIDQNALAKRELLNSLLSDSSSDGEGIKRDSSQKDFKQTEKKKTIASSESEIPNVLSSPGFQSKTASKNRRDSEDGPQRQHQRKSLILCSSSSSDDEPVAIKFSDNKIKQPLSNVSEFLKTDRKLNSKAVVLLKHLNARLMKQLLVNGVVVLQRKRRLDLSDSEALDRDIARLGNLRSIKMRKTKRKKINYLSDTDNSEDLADNGDVGGFIANKDKQSKEDKKNPVEKPKKRKPSTLFTSSEDDDSDKLEDDEPVAVCEPAKTLTLKSLDENDTKTMNDRAKELLQDMLKDSTDEQSDSVGSDSAEESKASSKVKNKKVTKEKKKNTSETEDDVQAISDDDDSDFVPAFKKGKKRFNSALLRAPLSDDSDVSFVQKSSDSRDGKRGKKNRKRHLNSSGDNASLMSSDSSDSSFAITRKTRKRVTRRTARSDDSDSRGGTKKKKRRRIKTMSPDSSDIEELSDDDAVGKHGGSSGKGGRKNIRKLIKDTKLREDTKFAAKEEEERRKRLASLQKLYNEIVEETAAGRGGPVTTKLVLAKDPKTEKTLLEVNPDLIRKLKPHQVEGVKFLWESVCETLGRLQTDPGSGCILAHCMGLGKTLQIISFLHTLLSSKRTYVKNALVVCPLNTVVNWYSECQMWLDEIEPSFQVIELSNVKSNYERSRALKNWFHDGGIMIVGYNLFRTLVQETGKRIPRSCKETFQKTLINPGPDIVVCDEGHILKNSATAISKAMCRIRTRRRIVLTGTPLQNNLSEYHCMVDFVKPNLLGTMKEFQNRFVHPIQNGQCADSTSFDVRVMKRRAHILHNLLDGCVQRRDYNVLTPFLPPKHEYVISVKLSDIQVKLYKHYLDNMSRKTGKNSLFCDYQNLMRIWTHPWVIRLAEIRQEEKFKQYCLKAVMKEKMMQNGNGGATYDSDVAFINDGSSDSMNSDNDSDNVVCLDDDDEPSTSKGVKHVSSEDEVVNNWKSSTRGGKPRVLKEPEVEVPAPCTNWWTEFVSEDDVRKIEHSGKILILFDILRECSAIGDKVLLFSQSLLSLNLIEDMLAQSTELADQGVSESEVACGTWINGIDYFRLDGMSSADQRHKCTTTFNDPDNYRARLFLISTRAGSLGINLVAANRVIVFDASWNPTHDVQSIFRVYRFGQEKPVYVYRFLAQGTMEEKIYDRQVTKQSLACRVVDEQQIERHFNFADLQELYTLNLENVSKRPTPMVPKDRLLAELLRKRKDFIISYHEHDSLLINQEEEELTEEERKAAWVEFEAERQGMLSEIAGGMPGLGLNFKVDMSSIIQEIQRKNPGLSVDDLKAKLHETVAMLHSARQQALEKERQEMIRLQQQQNQQRDIMMQMQMGQPNPARISIVQNLLQRGTLEPQPQSILPTMNLSNNFGNFPRFSYGKAPLPTGNVTSAIVRQPETQPPNQ